MKKHGQTAELLRNLQRLECRPGDVVVARVSAHLRLEDIKSAQESFRLAIEGTTIEGVKLLVFSGIDELAVCGRSEVTA